MKLLILAIICFLSFQVYLPGQAKEDKLYEAQGYKFEGFSINKKVYLYADKVNLRAEPDIQSQIVAELPITQELKILNKSIKKHNLNDKEDHWYKVQTINQKTGKKVEGYIWGGLIAILAFEENLDEDEEKEWFLVNWVENEDKLSSNKYELKVVDKGQVVHSIQFELEEQMMGDLLGGKKINASDDFELITLIFSAQRCSTINGGNVFFTFHNEQLNYGFTTMDGSDSGVFYRENEIRFPNDKGARKNHIIVNTVIKELNDENKWIHTVLPTQLYKWNGDKLVKVSK